MIVSQLVHLWEQIKIWIVMLVATASRSDVMFSACMCATFQASPRESHLKVTKRIYKMSICGIRKLQSLR
jgi:hypothetical protein